MILKIIVIELKTKSEFIVILINSINNLKLKQLLFIPTQNFWRPQQAVKRENFHSDNPTLFGSSQYWNTIGDIFCFYNAIKSWIFNELHFGKSKFIIESTRKINSTFCHLKRLHISGDPNRRSSENTSSQKFNIALLYYHILTLNS